MFKKILLGLATLMIILAIGIFFFLKAQSPKYSGKLQIPNSVQDSVIVIYDNYGIPHISAQNETDAYFALGYTHAQERLFQMDLIRRLAKGELAEILGPKLVSTDKMMRTLSIQQMAARSAKEFQSEKGAMQDAAQAYLNGVNSFIEKDRLPIEFTILGYSPTKFTLEDSYCSLGFMALGFTMTMKEEPLMELIYQQLGDKYLEDLGIDSSSIYKGFSNKSTHEESLMAIMQELDKVEQNIPLPLWEGSNSWAIAGSRSKSGKSLLANDTHIKYGQPSVWYEAHLEYPQGGIYGYFLAGVPFPIMGHNKHLGWGLTIFPVDNMDMYSETQNPDNENQYLVIDKWEDYEYRKEVIKVKDKENIIYDLRITRHGPVLNDAYENIAKHSEQPVSLWW
ncbi:MAG: penicillin acylase family protein, partial [Bacteroidetes bacterium]